MTTAVRIVRYPELMSAAPVTQRRAILSAIDDIFFDTAGPRTFADMAEKIAFRDRWLGRYLEHLPDLVLVAVRGDADRVPEVCGYLVGAINDPARDPLFADIPFFPLIADLMPEFPAHLHINLASDCRGSGLGARLVMRFAAIAQAAGARGLHIVTGPQSRNRSFYCRVGLREMREMSWPGGRGVMMGARLPLNPRPA